VAKASDVAQVRMESLPVALCEILPDPPKEER